jgi:hypothetical protein
LPDTAKWVMRLRLAARERGHKIPLIIDVDNIDRLNDGALAGTDVVIEFTVPGAAPELISRILLLQA